MQFWHLGFCSSPAIGQSEFQLTHGNWHNHSASKSTRDQRIEGGKPVKPFSIDDLTFSPSFSTRPAPMSCSAPRSVRRPLCSVCKLERHEERQWEGKSVGQFLWSPYTMLITMAGLRIALHPLYCDSLWTGCRGWRNSGMVTKRSQTLYPTSLFGRPYFHHVTGLFNFKLEALMII